jgi:hypothetical protein
MRHCTVSVVLEATEGEVRMHLLDSSKRLTISVKSGIQHIICKYEDQMGSFKILLVNGEVSPLGLISLAKESCENSFTSTSTSCDMVDDLFSELDAGGHKAGECTSK